MAKTSDHPCIAYQREKSTPPLPHPPLPFLIPPPAAEKVFPNELHNTLQARKSRAKLSSAWQHLHSCLILLAPSSTLLSFSPSPLQQVAISHYPRLKRLQGVAASASSSLTNNTPTTTTTTTAQQHSTQGVAPLGGTQACPSHFCTFLQMALHLRPTPHCPPRLCCPLATASKSYIRYMKTFFKSSTKNKIKKIFIEVPRWLLHCGCSGCVGQWGWERRRLT